MSADSEDWLPLNRAQGAIWFHLSLKPALLGCYNLCNYQEIGATVEYEPLRRALELVVANTAALRLRIRASRGHAQQKILPSVAFDFPLIDLSLHDDPDASALQRMHELRARPFDTSSDNLFRFTLLKLGDKRFLLFCHYHHLAVDGHGQTLINHKIGAAYSAFVRGEAAELADDLGSYIEQLGSEAAYRHTAQFEADKTHWRTFRANSNPVTLTTRVGRLPATREPNKYLWRLRAPDDLLTRLDALASSLGQQIPQLTIGLIVLFLHRVTGKEELDIGIPTHGRNDESSRSLVAACSNVLPVRFQVPADRGARDNLLGINQQLRVALKHRRRRLEDIRRDLELLPSSPPLFRIVVNAMPIPEEARFASVPARQFTLTPGYSDDLTIFAFSRRDGSLITFELSGNPALHEHSDLESYTKGFRSFISSLATNPERPASDLALHSEIQRNTRTAPGIERLPTEAMTALERFSHQARQHPHASALVARDFQLTYSELDQRSNVLAAKIALRCPTNNQFVAIALDDPARFIMAMLATWKAGKAFVPIDASAPARRNESILEDVRPGLVLAGTGAREKLRASDDKLLIVDDLLEPPSGAIVPDAQRTPVAYCMYTSGSTGKPNGVLVAHGNLANHAQAFQKIANLTRDDRVLQFAPLFFDASLEEIVPTLSIGATIVIPQAKPLGIRELLELLTRERVTVLNLPTSYWHALVENLCAAKAGLPGSIHTVIIGGERALASRWNEWNAHPLLRNVRLINTYGPTETTISATAYVNDATVTHDDPPIGKSLQNVETFVLDRWMRPLPAGFAGELCIGGSGVALGYLNRAELTADRFVASADAVGRIYRTGDLARYRPDGNLEFIGRDDSQFKVRGYRIEATEVEAALLEHSQISQCAVEAQPATNNQQLVAYLVLKPTEQFVGGSQLREFLRERIPDYLIPHTFHYVPRLPLTTSGKLDRQRLQALTSRSDIPEVFVAPRTEAERAIADIWRDALQVEQVGIYDNFFDLGGDSLVGIHVVAEMEARFERPVDLHMLFSMRTLQDLAELMTREIDPTKRE